MQKVESAVAQGAMADKCRIKKLGAFVIPMKMGIQKSRTGFQPSRE